jgi:hypothetical protein
MQQLARRRGAPIIDEHELDRLALPLHPGRDARQAEREALRAVQYRQDEREVDAVGHAGPD